MTDDTPLAPEDEAGTPPAAAFPDPGLLGLELPDDQEQAVGVLLDALATARAAADSYLEDLQRVAAEYENYRKRAARERDEIVALAAQRLVQDLLPVLDSFDQAVAHRPQTPGEEQLLTGVRGTCQQLRDILAKEGLEAIPTLGETFDPEVHEAVAGAAGDDLVVAQEFRRGYTLKGRVLRAAMVMVAPRPEEASSEASEG